MSSQSFNDLQIIQMMTRDDPLANILGCLITGHHPDEFKNIKTTKGQFDTVRHKSIRQHSAPFTYNKNDIPLQVIKS